MFVYTHPSISKCISKFPKVAGFPDSAINRMPRSVQLCLGRAVRSFQHSAQRLRNPSGYVGLPSAQFHLCSLLVDSRLPGPGSHLVRYLEMTGFVVMPVAIFYIRNYLRLVAV
jgi:hypothetical protein